MANRTAWTAGNGVGLNWATAFATTDFTAQLLATGWSVQSTVIIPNATALDQFMDISCQLSVTSGSTVAAGACFTFWIAPLLSDGTTWGDGKLTAGTAANQTPAWFPAASIPLFAAASQQFLSGSALNIIIPPGNFSLIIQNNSGLTLTSNVTRVWYRTYNTNLNF